MKNFEEINRAQGAKKTDKLNELRELRIQEKAIKARIDEISDEATQEAVAILSEKGQEKGEFEVEGHKYQLQRTDVIDMSNYNRYKGKDAVRWRSKAALRENSKKYQAALTKEMKGITDAFVATHPEWEPDEVKLTVKVIDQDPA